MDFTFTEDQLLFQASTRDFLTGEVTPERIRAGWETPDGRDPALWQQLAELGLTGITVPEVCSAKLQQGGPGGTHRPAGPASFAPPSVPAENA